MKMNNKIIEYAENIQALAEKTIEIAEEIKRGLKEESDLYIDCFYINGKKYKIGELPKKEEILNEKNNSKD